MSPEHDDQFYDFEKALRELRLEEDELKRLVSEGEIRAFRDAEKMKFKADDIARFRKRREDGQEDVIEALDKEASSSSASSPTIEAVDEIPEELIFDDEDDEIGMATQAISDDSFLDDVPEVEELDLGEPEPAAAAKPKRGGRGGAAKGGKGKAAGRKSSGSSAPKARRSSSSRAPAEEHEEEGMGLKIALIFGSILMLFAVLTVLDVAQSHRSEPTAMTRWVADMVRSMFS